MVIYFETRLEYGQGRVELNYQLLRVGYVPPNPYENSTPDFAFRTEKPIV